MAARESLLPSLPALSLFLLCFGFAKSTQQYSHTTLINRTSFPDGFIFGAGSSAYQYEGAAFADGKGPSMWDNFTHQHPEKIKDHSTGDVADAFYYRYEEDIAVMKEIGLDAFRFSISWPRVLPNGKISGGVNQKGVDFYNNLIDSLLAKGLQPIVTLFHWDLPQALGDEYGGFLSERIVDDFRDYADLCFKTFGDRVKLWITINEPYEFTINGYAKGNCPPGRCSDLVGNCTAGNSAIEPYIVAHHLLLSHCAALTLYRHTYKVSQKGEIGVTLSSPWILPISENVVDQKAALRAIDFALGWFLHPMTFGDYPQVMRSLVGKRIPKFTKIQSQMLKNSYDFLGVNYYTSHYAADAMLSHPIKLSVITDSRVILTNIKNGVPIGQPTDLSWLYVCPKGIRALMLYIKDNYRNPPIVITENGIAEANNNSQTLQEALNDNLRIMYHHSHLTQLSKAIKEGVNVRGYFVWSFMDNFEWSLGFTIRFGFIYVDYEDGLKRHLKCSAFWLKKFLQENSSSGPSMLQLPLEFTRRDSSVFHTH